METTPLLTARLYSATNQSIPDNNDTRVRLPDLSYDYGGFYDPANPHVLTIPKSGFYLITANVAYVSNANGRRVIYVKVNGTNRIINSHSALSGAWTIVPAQGVLKLNSNDTVELFTRQTSGGALNTTVWAGGNVAPNLTIIRI